jgi:hypothetical protein
MDTAAWVDGFRTGNVRKLGAVPAGMDRQSWLAGYFEGIDPPSTYYLASRHGHFQINRFDPEEGEPYAVEGGSFRTWRQAAQFLSLLRTLLNVPEGDQIKTAQGLLISLPPDRNPTSA